MYGVYSVPHIINPAINGDWDQQLKVEPESKVIIRLLVADIVDHTGLVQLGLQLIAQVAWNWTSIGVHILYQDPVQFYTNINRHIFKQKMIQAKKYKCYQIINENNRADFLLLTCF